MSKKQSRVVRSSSLGDIGLFNNVQAIETPAAVSRPVKPKQREPPPPPPHRGILTVGSPPRESDEDGDDIGKGFGVFLQSCFYCKKELSPSKDVFMAGYLRAFCSEKCRTTHIALEEAAQHGSSQLTQATTSHPIAKYDPFLPT